MQGVRATVQRVSLELRESRDPQASPDHEDHPEDRASSTLMDTQILRSRPSRDCLDFLDPEESLVQEGTMEEEVTQETVPVLGDLGLG